MQGRPRTGPASRSREGAALPKRIDHSADGPAERGGNDRHARAKRIEGHERAAEDCSDKQPIVKPLMLSPALQPRLLRAGACTSGRARAVMAITKKRLQWEASPTQDKDRGHPIPRRRR